MQAKELVEEIGNPGFSAPTDQLVRPEAVDLISSEAQLAVGRHHVGCSPLSRSGEEQLQTVAALNKVLARDGYELAQESELSGHTIFGFRSLVRSSMWRDLLVTEPLA